MARPTHAERRVVVKMLVAGTLFGIGITLTFFGGRLAAPLVIVADGSQRHTEDFASTASR